MLPIEKMINDGALHEDLKGYMAKYGAITKNQDSTPARGGDR